MTDIRPILELLAHFHALCQDESYTDAYSRVVDSAVCVMRKETLSTYLSTEDYWASHKGVFVLHFGAYGCTHVLACGHLEDALEDAAGVLPPGHFVTPDMPDGYEDMSEEEQDSGYNAACEDLTYTESGFIPSWEWSYTEFESLGEAIQWMWESKR